jgi:hypothetical protein
MKPYHRIGALFAVLCASMVFVAPVFAHEWKKAGIPVFQTEAVETSKPAEMTFADRHWEYAIKCDVVTKGTVGLKGASEVTAITGEKGEKSIPCLLSKPNPAVCESGAKTYIEAEGLPWKNELATLEGKLENALLEPKFGKGWKITCKTSRGFTFTNQCEAAKSTSSVINVPAGEGSTSKVTLEYATSLVSPRGNCSEDNGAKEIFETTGNETIGLTKPEFGLSAL